jgi:predicted enzyme related to lactoylglutathione lyase
VSVEDVDVAVATAVANGGKVVEPAHDLPGVGRGATITDPNGAELALFKAATGDPPDLPSMPPGRFMWNELHTTDPEKAVAFYEKVVAFSHHSVPSPAGPYHILSKGGVDRGGVTSHLPPGVSPHWLPFVKVDDVDATIERARKLGARIPMEPKNLMDIGRLGILEDPTGAVLALMKPRRS